MKGGIHMKIVVVRSPKMLSPLLRKMFHIKKN
ncbi:MAG: stage V sporulation protein SpoVM [Clostridia bacterium]|nr:stage V sporulation protein SpoVM [Clostridia bacterium]